MLPSRRAVAVESPSEPKRKATSTPSVMSACRSSWTSSTIRSFGLRPRKSSSLGMTACSVKLEEAPTRRTPRNSPVPRAARSASSSAARIASTRARYSAPASVNDSARVLRVKSDAPISFSRAATMREADGCESPSSRAAREKLPARATRTKSRRATMRSVMSAIHSPDECMLVQPGLYRASRQRRTLAYSRYGTNPQEKPMPLPERLAAFRANFEAGGPPYHAPAWVHELMHRATDERIASGAAPRARKAGERAPEFSLKDADGHEVSSRVLLANGPLVVTFYRGVWCPYCNMDLQALQEALPAIVERGAQLVAISPQIQSNSRKSQRENKVSFPILSDPGNEIAARFGLRFELPDYLIELYRDTFKNDLGRINGE